MAIKHAILVSAVSLILGPGNAAAAPVTLYSNLAVTTALAAATHPPLGGVGSENEAADDFVLAGNGALISEIKFIGLLTAGSLNLSATNLEFYRVFPNDSTFPPDGRVPTRNNSPSDDAFAERGAAQFASVTVQPLAASVTALNSVNNGINPSPNQATLGEGPVTGTELLFDITLSSPVFLPADHYFFVPQIDATGGSFYWLSAARPVAFPAGTTDLQAWIRNSALDPDWLRIGTDIVDGATPPTFNMAFELDGTVVPEPGTLVLLGSGLLFLTHRVRRRGRAN